MDASYRDLCLIICGPGDEPEEILARRRLRAGGRLCHIQTQGQGDKRVSVIGFCQEVEGSVFWHPPPASSVISDLGRHLGAQAGRHWTKVGPDAIILPENHQLQILSEAGQPRHIRILDQAGSIYVEMSGHVVLNPDMSFARYHHVDVKDDQMKAFGALSTRYVLLGGCLQTLAFGTRLTLSIHFESSRKTDILWWRVLSTFFSIFAALYALVDVFGIAFTGQHVSAIILLLGTCAILMATIPLQLAGASQFFAELASACLCLVLTAMLQYWKTRHSYPARQLGWSFLWVVGYILCTYGFVFITLLNGAAYMAFLARGYVVAGSLFLPSATAASEMVAIAVLREVYCRVAWPHRPGGTGAVPGDQLYIPVPIAVTAIHGSSECMRLAAVLAGAIRSNDFGWIGVAVSSYVMNIFLRLGWIRFVLFKAMRATCGLSMASRLFGVSSWVKLHDEVKVHAGYFRFIIIVALVTARAIAYGFLPFNHPQTPGFGLSASCAICGLLLTEILEDWTVLQQVLPESPVTVEMLTEHVSYMHPRSLATFEWRIRPESDEGRGEFTPIGCSNWESAKSTLSRQIALSQDIENSWGLLRRRLGQPGRFVPAPVLHGLRKIPFVHQATLMGIFCNMMMGMLSALLGDGYLRGLYPSPCGTESLFQNWIFWEVPLAC